MRGYRHRKEEKYYLIKIQQVTRKNTGTLITTILYYKLEREKNQRWMLDLDVVIWKREIGFGDERRKGSATPVVRRYAQ